MTQLMSFEQMLPGATGWQTMKQQAAELIKSGFLPQGIKTPEQACAIMLKGRELGIPPMQALSHIHIINGKPSMSSELMLSQILRLHPKTRISYPVRTGEKCEIKVQREGCDPSTFSFDMKDAQAAGVLGNPVWKKYPRAMLHARCVSEMARSLFPDAIAGVSYTHEELNPEGTFNEQGEIIDISPQVTTTTPPKHAVVPPAPTSTAAAPAPSKALHFDKTNVVHVKYVSQFLTSRNQLGLFETLAKRLEGKVFTQTMVAEEFKVIDPEAFSEPKEGV